MSATIEQELADASTALEQARASQARNDLAMMITALKDARKRVNRVLKGVSTQAPPSTIDPQLPTEPKLPIKDGEA